MPKYLYKSIKNLENYEEITPNWGRLKIDPKLLKELLKRGDTPAWINTILCFSVLIF